MQGHLARALWVLSAMEEKTGRGDEAESLKYKAREMRLEIRREDEDEDTDEAYSNLWGIRLGSFVCSQHQKSGSPIGS